ncbi:hypothetical protein KI387_032799, partial [Taxus chinensis]
MEASSSSKRQQNAEQVFGEIEAQRKKDQRSLAPPQLFDVFISHRGPDVKTTLATQLYLSLRKKRYRAFLDVEEIKGGDSISGTIQNAICSSSVQIAIFSRGYAESKWCLDELLLMLEQNKALFIPVFYEMAPWELRYIDKGAYAKAFSEFQRKERNLHKLDDWKRALLSASNIPGYDLSHYGHDLCDKIVSAVVKEMQKRRPIHVAKHPVGLEERVQDFETHCRNTVQENTKTVGIFGLGGSGKTTLAKELFNHKRSNYNASCFLNDVREASAKGKLHSLQTKILKDLFGEDRHEFDNVDEGTTYLRDRLAENTHSRFLIVLDDVDDQQQLDALAFRDMQNPGNFVIVTTRDQRVLTLASISVDYNMKGLNMPHAMELFCWHAFLQPYPDNGYGDLVESFVNFCRGLPLSLQVLGCHVSGGTRSYWELELDKVRNLLPDDIIQRLKISFDGLDGEEKQIFMDIACFFTDEKKDMAMRIWKGSGWNAQHALQTLRDKSLVELEDERFYIQGKQFVFRMHDHLRDLGRQMADQFSPPRLWQPQHLRSMESWGFRKILAETDHRCFHSIEDMSISSRITYFIGITNDTANASSVLLWLELDIDAGSQSKLKGIPSWIPVEKLQGLRVDGPLQGLWNPNLSTKGFKKKQKWSPNLQIKGFRKRHQQSPYLQIKRLQSHGQANFELKELVLTDYGSLPKLSKLMGQLNHLECLVVAQSLSATSARRGVVTEGMSLSRSLTKLSNLTSLVLSFVSLSGELALSNTRDSTHFESRTSSCMNSLQTIDISYTGLPKLSISGETCPRLRSLCQDSMEDLSEVDLKLVTTLNQLSLIYCYKLRTISGLSDVTELVTLSIEECWELETLPTLAHLRCLESITISRSHKLHGIVGIEELEGLKFLHLSGVSGGELWNCIYALKRMPSDVTT